MSSLRKKPGQRYWVCCFTDAEGIQRQRSSHSTDRRYAERMAWDLEEAYRRRMTESQIRRVLSDVHEQIHGRPLTDITFGEFFQQHRSRLAGRVPAATLQKLDDLHAMLKKDGAVMLAEKVDRIDFRQVTAFRDEIAKTRATSTANTNLRILKGVFRAAWQDGILSENPAGRVPPLKKTMIEEDEPGKRPFTTAELARTLKVADDEWRDMIYVGLYTGGQRIGDIATMQAKQVDLDHKTVRFRTQKTKRWVLLPIAPPLLPVLRARMQGLKPEGPLFPVANDRVEAAGGKVARVSNGFRYLLYKAGLATNPHKARREVQDGRRETKELSFHSLRHTATSMLKNAGVSDSVVMDIVGHESEAVSREYTHIDDKTKREALTKLPDITR